MDESASYGVTIIRDDATGALQRLSDAMASRDQLDAAAEAGAEVLRAHFAERNRTDAHRSATALGAKPTQLFADFADATSASVEGTLILLTVAHPAARQRWQGGDILPVGHPYLSIPAAAEAYGQTPGSIGLAIMFAMVLMPDDSRRPALVSIDAYRRTISKGKNAGKEVRAKKREKATLGAGDVLFWLVRKVSQQGDPTVIPDDAELLEGMIASLQGYADEAIQESGNG